MSYKDWDEVIRRKYIGIRGRLSARKRTGTHRRWSTSGYAASPSNESKRPSLRLLQIRYRLNSLRVLTFLVRIGFPRPWAMLLARWWEGVRHPWARASQ